MTTDQIKSLLQSNDRAVERAMVVLYERQTVDEQHTSSTRVLNGKGFNAFDASYGTYLAKYVISGRHLTGSHLVKARKMAMRYVGQLVEASHIKAQARTVQASV